jgi:hypothetical protein
MIRDVSGGLHAPSLAIVVSEESNDYWLEQQWLGTRLNALGLPTVVVRPQELHFDDRTGVWVDVPVGPPVGAGGSGSGPGGSPLPVSGTSGAGADAADPSGVRVSVGECGGGSGGAGSGSGGLEGAPCPCPSPSPCPSPCPHPAPLGAGGDAGGSTPAEGSPRTLRRHVDVVYRFFELFDLANVPKVDLLMVGVSSVPPCASLCPKPMQAAQSLCPSLLSKRHSPTHPLTPHPTPPHPTPLLLCFVCGGSTP